MKSGNLFVVKSASKISVAVVALSSLLTACGGGAGTPEIVVASAPTGATSGSAPSAGGATVPLVSTDPSSSIGNATTPTTPAVVASTAPTQTAPVSAPLTISGIAATGAAMASATVTAKCAVGNGSALSNSEGAYSIKIDGGLLPCVVQAKSADGLTEFHAAAEASALNFITANVTPLTELVVSRLHGNTGANLFANFEANKAKIDNINLAIATEKIKAILAPLVNLQNIDPHKAVLVAASASTNGNAHDKILDALRDALATAKIPLPDLLTSIVGKTDAAALAAVQKLITAVVVPPVIPPVTGCPSLKSGTYRVIEPAGREQYFEVSVDATNLTVRSSLGIEPFTANGCLLTGSLTGAKLAMGPQGVGVMRTGAGSIAAVIPKQDLTTADLAGTWSYVGRSKRSANAQTYMSVWGTMDFNSTGTVTSGQFCASPGCTPIDTTRISVFSKNSAGYFNESTGRFFPFRATNGSMGMLSIDAAGGDTGLVLMYVKGASIDLPAVDQLQKSYDLSLSASGFVGSNFSLSEFTVSTSYVPGSTYKRNRSSDCREESYSINRPFTNLLMQNANVYNSCATKPYTFEFTDNTIATSVKGFGMSVSVSVMAGTMIFSVEK
jgi:hypothetical protein